MKNYTTILNNITSKLDAGDTYRFTCLTFTPRKEGYTDCTFKQLAEYINPFIPESIETVKSFVTRLKKKEIIKIEEVWINGKRRNKYYIVNPASNFKMIKKELLEVDLSVQLKGFMIQLFSITVNNTYEVNLPISKIVTLIKTSKPTAIKYMRELIEGGYITETPNGYKLSNKYFDIGACMFDKIIKEIEDSIEGCEYLEMRFKLTDWENIKNPEAYWRSVVAGYTSKQKVNKSEPTLITV